MSTRAERTRFVERMKRDIAKDEPPKPTTPESRRRVVEVLHAEAGLPPPRWGRARAGPIDESPWKESRAASVRAMSRRLTVNGLAFDADRRAIYCKDCGEVIAAFPQGRIVAMGTTPSLLAASHQQKGCR